MKALKEHQPLLLFRVGPVDICAPVTEVDSIVVPQELTQIPHQAPSILGVFHYRNQTVSVISMHMKFGLPQPEEGGQGRIIMATTRRGLTGFLVDEIYEVTSDYEYDWRAPPRYVNGNVFDSTLLWEDKLILNTDFDRLQAMDEAAPLTAWVKEHRSEAQGAQAEEIGDEALADTGPEAPEALNTDAAESAQLLKLTDSKAEEVQEDGPVNDESAAERESPKLLPAAVTPLVTKSDVAWAARAPLNEAEDSSSPVGEGIEESSRMLALPPAASPAEEFAGNEMVEPTATSLDDVEADETITESLEAQEFIGEEENTAAFAEYEAEVMEDVQADEAVNQPEETVLPFAIQEEETDLESALEQATALLDDFDGHDEHDDFVQTDAVITPYENSDERMQESMPVVSPFEETDDHLSTGQITAKNEKVLIDDADAGDRSYISDVLGEDAVTEPKSSPVINPPNRWPLAVAAAILIMIGGAWTIWSGLQSGSFSLDKAWVDDIVERGVQNSKEKSIITFPAELGRKSAPNDQSDETLMETSSEPSAEVDGRNTSSALENTNGEVQDRGGGGSEMAKASDPPIDKIDDGLARQVKTSEEQAIAPALVVEDVTFAPLAPLENKQENMTPLATGSGIHLVVKGDTLWHLSSFYLSTPYKYFDIARLSRIKNPDRIYPGDLVRYRDDVDLPAYAPQLKR